MRALTGTDPDRLKEEKARGITIDLGFAHLDDRRRQPRVRRRARATSGSSRTCSPAPAASTCVMLVVAADESVMPQTREHFDICRLLQRARRARRADQVRPRRRRHARAGARSRCASSSPGRFSTDAPIVARVGATGDGPRRAARGARRRRAAGAPARRAERPARLPIDRVFSMKGFGTVVTGTLVAGRIAVGDELVILPRELRATARGLQVHGEARSSASAGERVAVNLGGVEVADVARGDSLRGARLDRQHAARRRPRRHAGRRASLFGTGRGSVSIRGRPSCSGGCPLPRRWPKR